MTLKRTDRYTRIAIYTGFRSTGDAEADFGAGWNRVRHESDSQYAVISQFLDAIRIGSERAQAPKRA